MRKFGILLFVVTMSVGAALAGGPFYAGAAIGNSSVKVDDPAGNFDGSDMGYKVYGGYRFMKFFGVEGSYVSFGEPDDEVGGTDVSIEATGWDAFAVGVFPIGKRFEVFGKLGFIFWDSDVDVSGGGIRQRFGQRHGLRSGWRVLDRRAFRHPCRVRSLRHR